MLKMLGLYLYTLTISHTFSNMLRILNKLTLYKALQTFETNNVFLDKKVKTQQQQQNKKIQHKTLAGNWTRDLLHHSLERYHSATEWSESNGCSHVSRATFGSLLWRLRSQHDLAAKSCTALNFVIRSRISKLFHRNDHHIETTCRVLGCYIEGQGTAWPCS